MTSTNENLFIISLILLVFMSLSQYLPPYLGVLFSILAFIIVVLGASKSFYNWCQRNYSEPKIAATLIVKPLSKEEEYVKEIIIPKDKIQIVYFRIKPTDCKKYDDPTIWIDFKSEDFKIDFRTDYTKFKFGKKPEMQRDYLTMIQLKHDLQQGSGVESLVFPIIFRSPSKSKTYDIEIEFNPKTIKKSTKQKLQFTVTGEKRKYSHELKWFQPSKYEAFH